MTDGYERQAVSWNSPGAAGTFVPAFSLPHLANVTIHGTMEFDNAPYRLRERLFGRRRRYTITTANTDGTYTTRVYKVRRFR